MPLSARDWHQRFLVQAGWTREARHYVYHRVGINHAQRVLDVGCGTGALCEELNQQVDAPIIGLDINFNFLALASANSPATRFILADGLAMPFGADSFDCCVCHFLLLWVEDPLRIIEEMKRVTQAGGAILVMAEPDYGGRIDFPPTLSILGEWQTAALRHQGADPHIGRQLSGILHRAGLVEIEVGVIGAQWLEGLSKQELNSEWEVIQSDLESLNISPEEMDSSGELRQLELETVKSGERILYVPTFYAWGKVPD